MGSFSEALSDGPRSFYPLKCSGEATYSVSSLTQSSAGILDIHLSYNKQISEKENFNNMIIDCIFWMVITGRQDTVV